MQTAAASLSTTVRPTAARARTRPAARLLGIHPLLGIVVSLQLAILLFDVISFQVTGLSLTGGVAPALGGIAAVLALWGYFVWAPGRYAGDWVFAETFLTVALFLLLGTLLGPGQYGAAALNRPYVDSALAAADHAMGIDVSALAAWTRQHPLLVATLTRAYYTLLPQFFLPFLLLGFVYRDRRALWEYVALMHVAAAVTVVCFALWPAMCAPQFYGFDPVGIDQSRVFRHLPALRDGTMTIVRLGDIDGLVSVPSFHVLGAMCVTWAFRGRLWLFLPLLAVNVMLTAATFVTGVHYAVDVVAAWAIFPCAVALYRRVAHLIEPPPVARA